MYTHQTYKPACHNCAVISLCSVGSHWSGTADSNSGPAVTTVPKSREVLDGLMAAPRNASQSQPGEHKLYINTALLA